MDTIKPVVKGKGLYLYCVRPGRFPYTKSAKSVSGKGESFIIPIGELDAVVGEVDLDEFGSKEIQKKADEDLDWIKEKCQIHEYVIEQAMRFGREIIPTIPMKFGTIFNSKERLEAKLLENYIQIKDGLVKVKGRQEWGVKVYLKKEDFLKWVEGNNSDVRAKKEKIAKLPQGAAFFEQKKLKDVIDRIYSEELGKVTQDMFTSISSLAENGTRAKNLTRELTGKKEEMVFNAYFLIKEEKVEEFRKGVENILKDYGLHGFQAVCIGALPPYHFI